MLSLDIANAFLEGDTDFENYMYLPKDLTLFLTGDKSAKLRVKLNKSLYGIKQAAKVFNDKVNDHLLKIGFERLTNDVCLYVYEIKNDFKNFYKNDEKFSKNNNKNVDEKFYYAIIHVDDIIIFGKVKNIIQSLINKIESGFKRIVQAEKVSKYLGINLKHEDNF
jgi:hypothetical protein